MAREKFSPFYSDPSPEIVFEVSLGSHGFTAVEVATIIRNARKLHLIAERQCNGYSDGRGNPLPGAILDGWKARRYAELTGNEVTIPAGLDGCETHGRTDSDGRRWLTAEDCEKLRAIRTAAYNSVRTLSAVSNAEWRDLLAEERASEAIRKIVADQAARAPEWKARQFVPVFGGDPRGAVVKLYSLAYPEHATAEGRDRSSNYLAVP